MCKSLPNLDDGFQALIEYQRNPKLTHHYGAIEGGTYGHERHEVQLRAHSFGIAGNVAQ
jgi:hypothetical protein